MIFLAAWAGGVVVWNMMALVLTFLVTIVGAKKLWGDVWRQNAEGYKAQVDALEIRVAALEKSLHEAHDTINRQSGEMDIMRHWPTHELERLTSLLEAITGKDGMRTAEAYRKIDEMYVEMKRNSPNG